jgi:hypothetical protein
MGKSIISWATSAEKQGSNIAGNLTYFNMLLEPWNS